MLESLTERYCVYLPTHITSPSIETARVNVPMCSSRIARQSIAASISSKEAWKAQTYLRSMYRYTKPSPYRRHRVYGACIDRPDDRLSCFFLSCTAAARARCLRDPHDSFTSRNAVCQRACHFFTGEFHGLSSFSDGCTRRRSRMAKCLVILCYSFSVLFYSLSSPSHMHSRSDGGLFSSSFGRRTTKCRRRE